MFLLIHNVRKHSRTLGPEFSIVQIGARPNLWPTVSPGRIADFAVKRPLAEYRECPKRVPQDIFLNIIYHPGSLIASTLRNAAKRNSRNSDNSRNFTKDSVAYYPSNNPRRNL